MRTDRCSSLKDSIVQHLLDRTAAEQTADLCIVTLPIRTIDGRLVDVFIEARQADVFLVHDGGKAANELILNGVSITPAMHDRYAMMAHRLNLAWSDEMFQTVCKADKIGAAALAVASCSSFAVLDLLGHVAEVQVETVHAQVGTALRSWSRNRAKVKEAVGAKGEWDQHVFDFVAIPKAGKPIAINIINPAGNPLTAARRAAFRVRDLEDTSFKDWRKVSIRARSEMWTPKARDLVTKCSTDVIDLATDEVATPSLIASKLDRLVA